MLKDVRTAANQQPKSPQSNAPGVQMNLKFFVCWDCDKKHLNPYFAVQSDAIYERPLRCPRYPAHQHIDKVGLAEAKIKWIEPTIGVFVD